MPQAGFEPIIPGQQRAADPRFRPRGDRDRQDVKYPCKMSLKFGYKLDTANKTALRAGLQSKHRDREGKQREIL